LERAGVKGPQVLRVTCFLGSLEDAPAARAAMESAFAGAALAFVQDQRLSIAGQTVCEAVGRLEPSAAQLVSVTNGIAAVSSPKLILTGTQLIFRDRDDDVRLGFQRLGKAIAALGSSMQDVIWAAAYSLTKPDAAKLDTLQWEFLKHEHPPAGTAIQIEGLPSTDATGAIEFIAVGH
jgi:enamine deaminase RidA (YjgF/YER057c/UK114 family)